MKKFLSLVLALILVMSMALGMVSCDTTDDPSNDTQQTEANELEEAKAAAKTALESYVNSENYRDAEKTLLEAAIADVQPWWIVMPKASLNTPASTPLTPAPAM